MFPFCCGCTELFGVSGFAPVVQAFWELGRLFVRFVSNWAPIGDAGQKAWKEREYIALYLCEPSLGLEVCFLPASDVLALEADFIVGLATPLL
jgi:hypothetical protein